MLLTPLPNLHKNYWQLTPINTAQCWSLLTLLYQQHWAQQWTNGCNSPCSAPHLPPPRHTHTHPTNDTYTEVMINTSQCWKPSHFSTCTLPECLPGCWQQTQWYHQDAMPGWMVAGGKKQQLLTVSVYLQAISCTFKYSATSRNTFSTSYVKQVTTILSNAEQWNKWLTR